jgi:ACS family D-galactonate transporter-like MFS transporter
MASSTACVSKPTEGSSRWLVVGLLTIGVIMSYMSRISLSVALPDIQKSIHLSPASIGILLSAFFWAYTLLQTPAGWIVDRFGVKWPYAVALLLWSGFTAATALASSLGGLILVRVLRGVGEAFLTPASIGYIRKHFPERQRGLPVGIFMSGTKYGPAIGAPVTAYLVQGYGWRWMFVLSGTVSLLWLIPWILFVKGEGPPAASLQRNKNTISWHAILSAPVVWGSLIGTFCYMYFVNFCVTWMPIYFNKRYGLSLTASGWYTFMSFGGMATVAILAGWAADSIIARGFNPVTVRRAFTIAGFVVGSSELVGMLSRTSSMAMFWVVFSLCGLGLATANYWALAQTLTPASIAGRVAGIQNTAANLAGVAAAWFTGILVEKTGSFNAPLVAIGLWLVIGTGCYVFLVREKYTLNPV